MDRKGVEMSLNLIIMVVLGLIVLVLVVYLMTSNVRRANPAISGCQDRGGQCRDSCGPGEQPNSFFTTGCESGEVCCIREDRFLGIEEN